MKNENLWGNIKKMGKIRVCKEKGFSDVRQSSIHSPS